MLKPNFKYVLLFLILEQQLKLQVEFIESDVCIYFGNTPSLSDKLMDLVGLIESVLCIAL